MFIVVVTGGIASGKSTVTKVFEKNGIPIVDADKIAREIVEPGKPCWKKIKEAFGDDVLLPSREIDRAALGLRIFNDKELRGKLNQITHPAIHRTIFIQVLKHFMSGRSWIVLDLPLFFETGLLMDFVHKVITVTCDSDIQLKRLMTRNEYTAEDARKRIESQMPLDKKCEKSHFVVDNNGSIEATEASAERIYNMMRVSNQHWRNRFIFLAILFAVGVVIYFLNQTFNFLPKVTGLA